MQALWTQVFGDPPAVQERFYRLCACPWEPLVLRREGELGGILSPAPMTLCCPNGRELKGCYLYALAVAPALRGQGLAAALMGYAQELIWQAGSDCILLVPAQPSLFGFFEKLGYETAFFHRVWTPEGMTSVHRAAPIPVNAGEYSVLRQDWLNGRAWVEWPEGPLEFQRELSRDGGGLFCQDLPHGAGCAAVELTEDAVLVKELLCAPEDLDMAAGGLADAFPSRELEIFLPPWAERGELRPWGMIQWLYGHPSPWMPRDQSGYFGLAFD